MGVAGGLSSAGSFGKSGSRTVRAVLKHRQGRFSQRDPESAASRAYYALYHMTVLLLRVVRGIERDRWDHDQLLNTFLHEFCRLHFKFSRSDGEDWAYVLRTRFMADYGRDPLTRRRAQRSVERAERLVNKMLLEIAGDA